MRYVILFGGGLSYLFWLQVVLIRTQPEKTCPTKNVVFIGVSGFVVLMQSYHLLRWRKCKEKGRGIKGFPCLFEFCDYSVVGFPVLSESPPAVLQTVMLSPTLTHVSVSST